jgi:hypothetical protein
MCGVGSCPGNSEQSCGAVGNLSDALIVYEINCSHHHNYTIVGTRGRPDFSHASYATPLFPAGDESWVAISASPINTTRITRTVVVSTGRNASTDTVTRQEDVEVIMGTENHPNPEFVEDLFFVVVTDLGDEGGYELNKPMRTYQSVQFADTYERGFACKAFQHGMPENGYATQNQTCSDYEAGTAEVALTNGSRTQTYCYSAFILNVRTKQVSQRYQFHFTCPPETLEPSFAPTPRPTEPYQAPGPPPPTTMAYGTEAFIEGEIAKAEQSVVEIVVIFCAGLFVLIVAILMINSIGSAKRHRLDLENLPEKDVKKICENEGPPAYTMASRISKLPSTDAFEPPNPKQLKWS